MAAEDFKAFFGNPDVLAALEACPDAETVEDAVRAYAEVAGKFGYDLTAEDFEKAFPKSADELKARTDATIEEIGELTDEDLEKVAGGESAGPVGSGCIRVACAISMFFDYWCDANLIHKI